MSLVFLSQIVVAFYIVTYVKYEAVREIYKAGIYMNQSVVQRG